MEVKENGVNYVVITEADFEETEVSTFETFEEARAYFLYGVQKSMEMDEVDRDENNHTVDEIVNDYWYGEFESGRIRMLEARKLKVKS